MKVTIKPKREFYKFLKIIILLLYILSVNQKLAAQVNSKDRITNTDIVYTKSFKEGKIIDLDQTKTRGSRLISNSKDLTGTNYREDYEYDVVQEKETILMKGAVSDFNISYKPFPVLNSEFIRFTEMLLTYKWEAENTISGEVESLLVKDYYYFDNGTSRILKLEFCNGVNSEFMGWAEKLNFIENNHVAPDELDFFKVKRINSRVEEGMVFDYVEPEQILTYALLTPDGFYRESLNGVRDSIVFNSTKEIKRTKIENTEFVTYPSHLGDFTLIHIFSSGDTSYYASSMDALPFPNDKNEKITTTGEIIIWEKFHLTEELFNLNLKIKLAQDLRLTNKEISDLISRNNILLRFFKSAEKFM